ncbi:hypothetical protein GCM10011361_01840 [Muriicola marianensis]|uniref:Uncharacterized protein n=1 Tax=Muriicola marianensis TaxID=1324801 RepID=A0ABQ1QR82_9FLAO|nr:hypothetical protein GCM10011361_01840 [Muriicola marianensis]
MTFVTKCEGRHKNNINQHYISLLNRSIDSFNLIILYNYSSIFKNKLKSLLLNSLQW